MYKLKPYRSYPGDTLQRSERPFLNILDFLFLSFCDKCRICIHNDDFERTISAVVINRETDSAVIICLKYAGVIISNPINPGIIRKVRHHIDSQSIEDLRINFPQHI